MTLTDFTSDLRTFLAAQSVGTAGTDLFRGMIPANVINAVLLVDTGGDRSDSTHGSVIRTVQVTCRHVVLATAIAKANAVYGLLNEPSAPRTMGASRVTYSKAIQPPFTLGQDERQAWRVVANYEFLLAL